MLWEKYCPLMWSARLTTYGAHGRRVVHLVQDIIEANLFDGVIFDFCFFQLALSKLKRQGKKVLIGDKLSSHMTVEVITTK